MLVAKLIKMGCICEFIKESEDLRIERICELIKELEDLRI